ncbi:succinyl-CoA synthetase beta subunit [Geosmithia morbida]|uniref:Succinyl-CoA synthetase beta subunit n=1 Tax=Geosmithia morbida TaxID=1094350 RepID=A0A9P5D1L5_9HYPO|nr:succinyl-CoA synthetase beta subunit [Geosmithia morbida]KAF4122882.1 succinyl-CoA synthetase beta subunit [Geosmithia morbida]
MLDVPVTKGRVSTTPSEVELGKSFQLSASSRLISSGGNCDTKPQISGGGVQDKRTLQIGLQSVIWRANYDQDAETIASKIMDQVSKLYVAETGNYDDGLYLAVTIVREKYSPVIIMVQNSGVDVATVATQPPEKLSSFHSGISEGITPQLGLQAVGTKFTTKRQGDLFSQRDTTQDDAEEVEAEKYGIVYVRMEGTTGNVVNGAGLVMAINDDDAVGLYGDASVNFLDAGGQTTMEMDNTASFPNNHE